MAKQSETPFDKITASMIYEHLKSKNVIDNLYQDVLAHLKETSAYRQMKEVAVTHMTKIIDSTNSVPCPEDREEKKKQIAEIGLLALSIDSSMSQIVSENLAKAKSIIYNSLKELTRHEIGTESPKKQNSQIIPEHNAEKYNNSSKDFPDSDNESNSSSVSLCVSSVHTSDLSSFEDEIVVSEEEDGITVQRKVPFKYVNELMLNNAFSDANQEEVTDQHNKTTSSKPFVHSKKSKVSDASRRILPKRIRKPNSKYSSKDMLLLDASDSRHKELLDLQKDLNIINEANPNWTKGQSSKKQISNEPSVRQSISKSPRNKKRKTD